MFSGKDKEKKRLVLVTDSMFLFVCVFVRLSDCGSDNETIEVF